MENYQAVFLIGGLGTRLKSITERVPKPMVDINGKPFLEIKMETLKKYGIKNFIFCVGYLGNIIEEYFGDGNRFGVNIEYSYEKDELLGTAGAIKNAEHLIKNRDFIVLNGDTYLDVDIKKLIEFHESYNSPFTMVICNASHPKTQELIEFNEFEIKNIYRRDTVEHEKHLRATNKPLVNAGLYVINRELLKLIPQSKKVSLEQEILPNLVGKIKGFLHNGYFLDIADEGDWKEFIKDFNKGFIMPSLSGYKKIIRARAPVRISFGGGGTDIYPYDREYGGVCVGATINKYVYSSLKLRDDKKIKIKSDIINIYGGFETYEENFDNINDVRITEDSKVNIIKAIILEMQPAYGFELYVRSEVPPHSGLGGSASLCVSVIGVFNHLRKKDRLTRHEIAETAFKIEDENLKNKGGRQDQYATAFGGINLYEFKGEDKIKINPIGAEKNHILEFEKNLLIVFSGRRTTSSGEIHTEESQKFFDNFDKLKILHEIKDNGIETEYNLRRGNLKRVGELIMEGWTKKKKLNPSCSNTYIDALIEEAIANGAIGARLMGAGGGGHLLIYCKPDYEHKVKEALSKRGAKAVDFSFDFNGLQIWEIDEE